MDWQKIGLLPDGHCRGDGAALSSSEQDHILRLTLFKTHDLPLHPHNSCIEESS